MEKSTGPTYSRYSCCAKSTCSKFDSPWEAGDCYAEGGKIVKSCASCK
jgi:hypothetical protein